MRLEDFRINVALMSRKQLADAAKVAQSTIQRIEEGEPYLELTRAKLLRAFSQHLGREVKADEIDEFRKAE